MDENIVARTYNGPSYTFTVLSRPLIREATFARPYIVISVSDPGDEDAEVASSPHCRAVLRLQFDDVDPQRHQLRGRTAMSVEDAVMILDFVEPYIVASDVTTIVCQCSMGISRSAGIAAALSQLLQGEDTFFSTTFSPNQHVYQMLLTIADGLGEAAFDFFPFERAETIECIQRGLEASRAERVRLANIVATVKSGV